MIAAAGGLVAGVCFLALAGSPQAQDRTQPVRFSDLAMWADAIEQHVPGRHDAALRSMLTLTGTQLRAVIPYMAHAIAATYRREGRGGVDFEQLFGQSLRNVSIPSTEAYAVTAAAERIAFRGRDRFLKRAAILHADIALFAPHAHVAASEGGGSVVSDGQPVGTHGVSWNWMLGRAFLHLVRDKQQDSQVLLWYQATGNHLWRWGNFTEAQPHLRAARRIFPQDAELNFLEGVVHEAFAAPYVQTAVEEELRRSEIKVSGNRVTRIRASTVVGSISHERGRALAAFQRAIETDANHVEARIRFGRLLSLEGRQDRAAAELRTALTMTAARRQLYFAQLFLGRAEELAGRITESRAAYVTALEMFPRAQSPRLALSRLDLHAGRREAAAAAIDALARDVENDDDGDDPWWTYHRIRVPDETEWLTRMWKAFEDAA